MEWRGNVVIWTWVVECWGCRAVSGVVCESSSDQATQISFLDGGKDRRYSVSYENGWFLWAGPTKIISAKKNPPLYPGVPSWKNKRPTLLKKNRFLSRLEPRARQSSETARCGGGGSAVTDGTGPRLGSQLAADQGKRRLPCPDLRLTPPARWSGSGASATASIAINCSLIDFNRAGKKRLAWAMQS